MTSSGQERKWGREARVAHRRARAGRFRTGGWGGANMGELAAVYLARISDRVGIRPDTRRRLREEVLAIRRTWPGFDGLRPGMVTRDAVEAWRNRVAREGTGHRPPGSKTARPKNDGSSSSLINKCIDALCRMLEIAADRGELASNPLESPARIKLRDSRRKPNLPEARILEEVFAAVGSGGGRFSKAGEVLCRFLAYTGCRLGEARALTWADVELERGFLRVRGAKTEAADREVPLIPAARGLLKRLKSADTGPADRVLRVGECGKVLERACREVGVGRLTHHDLRDAFATSAIEAGVDVPTVAAWLGHSDGGAVLMRIYAHHRRAHSLVQAAKVLAGT